jgi:hypothetical protein
LKGIVLFVAFFGSTGFFASIVAHPRMNAKQNKAKNNKNNWNGLKLMINYLDGID